MGVDVTVIGGGDAGATSFQDSFVRANNQTWGTNWMRTSSNIPGGAGNGITAWAEVSANQAVMNTLGGAGATQGYQITWIPLPVFLNVFNLPGYFVQYTFVSVGGSSMASALRYNHNMLNTQTQGEGSDFYLMIHNGRIDKTVGGGAQNVIGASTWAQVANDVLRFEVLTSGSSVILQSIRNGVVLQQVTDSAVTRILQGGPGMQINSFAATGQQAIFKNFSCGPLAALSV